MCKFTGLKVSLNFIAVNVTVIKVRQPNSLGEVGGGCK